MDLISQRLADGVLLFLGRYGSAAMGTSREIPATRCLRLLGPVVHSASGDGDLARRQGPGGREIAELST